MNVAAVGLAVAFACVCIMLDDWILLIIRVCVWVGVHRGCAVAACVEGLTGPGDIDGLWGFSWWLFGHGYQICIAVR